MTPASFVLVGTILSYDSFLATVSFDLNPKTNGKPGVAVMPVSSIPCEIEVGKTIYVVKDKMMKFPQVTCQADSEKRLK